MHECACTYKHASVNAKSERENEQRQDCTFSQLRSGSKHTQLHTWWWLLLYSAILRSRADSLRSHVILHEWLAYFIARFLISTEVVYLQRWHGWCHMNLLPSRRVLCTPYNHAPCHFMQSHMCKVYACLAVTCHLHFWQDDRDLLRATAVTRGWNGYRNRSQHRKLTLEKKILPPFPGFEPATFQSRVRRSNHWAIPTELSHVVLPHTFLSTEATLRLLDFTCDLMTFCFRLIWPSVAFD